MGGEATTYRGCQFRWWKYSHPGPLQATTWDNWSCSWEEVWTISSAGLTEAGSGTPPWGHGREISTAEVLGTQVNWDLSVPWAWLQPARASIPGRTECNNHYITINNLKVGLPWWRSGWESACQCRERGFEPWSGKIPHATEQLGPWATITEPARLEPVLRNKRGRDSERPAHRDEEWPPLATTRESPRTETKTQHSHTYIHTYIHT